MKKLITLLLSLIWLSACNQAPSSTDSKGTESIDADSNTKVEYTILALGDSLTEGLGVPEQQAYPAQLQKKLAALGYQGIEVINAGLSGETTSGLKNRLNWVLKQKPDMTILNIGANDAMRGLPLDLTQQNMQFIIEKILASDSQLILGGMQIYDNLGREYVQGFKDIFPRLAKDYKLPMIAFFLQDVAGIAELNQADLIHPNAKGYEIIVNNNILPVVIKNLPETLKTGSK